jgi:hypothetical protein
MNDKEYAVSGNLIRSQIKSLIAEKLWDVNASFIVINQDDQEVQKAINVMKNDALFDKQGIQR